MTSGAKFATSHGTSSESAQELLEAAFHPREPVLRYLESNRFADVTAEMGEFEPDNRVSGDEAVLTNLAIEPDVESECAQAVVAVCHSDEWPERFRPLVRRNEPKSSAAE